MATLKNILFADNPSRTLFEQKELSKFGDVFVVDSVPSLIDRLSEREYSVAIVDPLELTIGAYMSLLSVHERVRDVVVRIRDYDIPVIFATNSISADVFGLKQGEHYQTEHVKPYNMTQLVQQLETLRR